MVLVEGRRLADMAVSLIGSAASFAAEVHHENYTSTWFDRQVSGISPRDEAC